MNDTNIKLLLNLALFDMKNSYHIYVISICATLHNPRSGSVSVLLGFELL